MPSRICRPDNHPTKAISIHGAAVVLSGGRTLGVCKKCGKELQYRIDHTYANDPSGKQASLMSMPMITPAEPFPTQVQDFVELLRRAAAYSRLVRFRSHVSRGVFKMIFNEIGATAGAVWETLSNEGPLNLATLMDEVNAPESIFFMAIGWLAREDKLTIEPAGGDYTVRLK